MPLADGEWVDLPPHTRRNRRREGEQATSIKVAEGIAEGIAEGMTVGDSVQLEHQAHCLPIGIAQDHRLSAEVNIGYSYEYQDEELTGSFERGQIVPGTIARVEAGDSRNTIPAHVSSSFTATFDARTMTEVTTKSTKKMPKGKAKAIRANRNKTCEKHRKQKKQCDPDTCPGNKRWGERQENIKVTAWELSEESELAERARASREAAKRAIEEERIEKETARMYKLGQLGYGDAVEAIETCYYNVGGNVDVDNGSFHSEFQSAEVTEQTKPLSFLLKEEIDPAETDTKVKERAPFQPKPEPDRHPFQDALLRIEATEEEKQIWNQSGIEIPRSAWGGLGSNTPREFGKMDSEDSNYYLANSPLAMFDDTYARHVDGDKATRGVDEDSGDDGGELDENRGRGAWNSNEYGDWFQGYDTQWEDGAGPSGSGRHETGGGYRKPGGGYYALASELGVKMAKMSLK